MAIGAGAVVGAFGAVILGEYPFSGFTVFAAAGLYGLFLAETVAMVARRRDLFLSASGGVLAGIGLLWAAWISTGHLLGTLAPEGWVAVLVGAAVAAWRLRPRRTTEAVTPAG